MITAVAILSVKVMFTGILTFVPSAKKPGLIRVLAVNARVPPLTENVPAHVTYVVFDVDDLASRDPQKSRQPDFQIKNGRELLGVCLIKGEYLDLGPFSSMAPEPDIDDGLPKEMFQCCSDSDGNELPLDNTLLVKTPDPARVGMRIDLAHGDLGNETASIDPAASNVVDRENHCRPLTRLVSLTLPTTGSEAKLTIKSTPFEGSPQQKPLMLRKAGGELRILIGNEPLADIGSTSDFLLRPNDVHTGPIIQSHAGAHMRILNRLTAASAKRVLTPVLIEAARCVGGVAQITDPTSPTGKPDGCNPGGTKPTDPPK